MLFRELSLNPSTRNGRNSASKCCCFLSPSGRYGVYISRIEVFQSRPIETHFYNYSFTISDFILDTTIDYISKCGPFKRFHRFYYLNDTTGILVDFSRNNGNVTQNVIQFSHVNYTVTCEYGRIWNFNVDDMLYETDNSRMICTTALMKDNDIIYLPLLGEKDHISRIFVRFVPANPFDSSNFTTSMLEINVEDAYHSEIRTAQGEILQGSAVCTDTTCYPLINETSLYFVVRLRREFLGADRKTCVAMLKIDFKNYFENDFSTATKINTAVLPLKWSSSTTEKLFDRPRFVRIMAQEGHIALFQAFIFGPKLTWILINIKTMTMILLKSLGIASDNNCVMIYKNRFILHIHHRWVISDYDFIWSYYSVPKLQHLALWDVIDVLKKFRTKKCWDFHLSFDKFCLICFDLQMTSRLLNCCSDDA